MSEAERKAIVTIANSELYRDLPPSKIVPILADEGRYVASESSFYRVLRAENQLTHRHNSKPAKHHKPRPYVAFGPNQVWAWDISYLPSQVHGMYFYLYLILRRTVDSWLPQAVSSMRTGRYDPQPLKRLVFKDEVVDSLTIPDRILQHVLLHQLKPTFKHIIHPGCWHLYGPSGVKYASHQTLLLKTQRQLMRATQKIARVLKERHLTLSRKKSCTSRIDRGFHFLGVQYNALRTQTRVCHQAKRSLSEEETPRSALKMNREGVSKRQ